LTLSQIRATWRNYETWEAIGMSRASWYRHGNPTEKPPRPSSVANEARKAGVSVRTHQRMRVLGADIELAALMLNQGWCKPGQAERIIANPAEHRRFRGWLKAEMRRQT
jgi:hypothetical protein